MEERSKDVKEFNFECDTFFIERVLGVLWMVETDTFSFKVFIKEKFCIRRGIFSVVSLVYDSFGMAAFFVFLVKFFF